MAGPEDLGDGTNKCMEGEEGSDALRASSSLLNGLP